MGEVITYDQVAKGLDLVTDRVKREGLDPNNIREGVILGSGLGEFVEAEMEEGSVKIPFDDVLMEMEMPGVARTGVPGHARELAIGPLKGTSTDRLVIAQAGREHPYEGVSTQRATVWLRIMQLLKVQSLIGSNAAGIVTPDTLKVLSLMLVKGDKDFTGGMDSPLLGPNDDRFGPRFPHMSDQYPAETRRILRIAAAELGIEMKEGIYGRVKGPRYEPRTLVYEFRKLLHDMYSQGRLQPGEDGFRESPVGVFGMSSTYEAEVAQHASQSKIHPAFKHRAWISTATNYSASLGEDGIKPPNDHDEVKENAKVVQDMFQRLVRRALLNMRGDS